MIIFVALALAALAAFSSAPVSPPMTRPAAPPITPAFATRAAISPASVRLFAGASLQFRASFAGGASGSIAWSVVGPGSVGSDGTYSAGPAVPGDRAIVLATSGDASAAAAVSVVAAPSAGTPLVLVACYDGGALDVRDAASSDDAGMTSTGDVASSVAASPTAGGAAIAAGDRVGAFDPATSRLIFSGRVSGARFSEVAALAGGYVAATDNEAAAGQDGVRIFGPLAKGAAPALAGSAPAGDTPEGIAVSSDGKTFFVTNVNSNSVMRYSFDGRGSARLTGAARTGHRPFGIAVDDVHGLFFVADNDTPTLSGASSAPGLEVFALGSMRLVRRVATGTPNALPLGVAADPRANRLFVTNEGDGDVAVFSIAPWRRIATLAAGKTPWLPSIDRVRGRLLVPNAGSDSLSIFDVRSLRTIEPGAPTCGYPTSAAAL